MFLAKNFSNKTGRTYLQIVHSYRDTSGKTKRKVEKSLGYLDELEKTYTDPIAHFTEIAKQMEADRIKNKYINIQLREDEKLDPNNANRKNYGHIVFSKIYHELQLDRFFNNKQRHTNFEFDSNSIMKVLLFSRLLYPCSKRKSTEIKERYFDKANFTLDDVYAGLSHFNSIAKEAQKFIHEQITENYGRDTSLLYYDVTNYYFETDKQDGFRMRGASKEKRKDPIVQMGLALDRNSIPLGYQLFSGNTHDSQTLMPVLANIKQEYDTKRIIVVADKALNSGDNIAFNTILGDGYVYSQTIRGSSEAFKTYVLDEEGYVNFSDEYKMKSRTIPVEIHITVSKGKKKKMPIDQKQIVFYSQNYSNRAKHKRDELISKAIDLINNPSKYRKSTAYGAAGYVNNLDFDKETGEILELGKTRFLDLERIKEEEKFDGYYSIITSELDESDSKIIDIYRGLWRIEETFKITKSQLNARPVFVYKEEHINAHFLICFISLVIARLTEIRIKNKFSIARILESLRQVECSHIDSNHYLFDYIDEVTDALESEFNVGFGKKAMTLGEIKRNFASVKKR